MESKQEKLLKSKNAELEKQLAAKNRDLEIEAALEKVRSRSLAMHKSDELHEVVTLLAEKLQELDVNMEGAVICLPVEDKRGQGLIMWSAMAAQVYAPPIFVPYQHPMIILFSEAWEKGTQYIAKSWTYEEKTNFWKWAFEHSDFKYLPEGRKNQILGAPSYALSTAFSKNSAITIPSHTGQVLSDLDSVILKRFAKVFDQAYIRFLDLKQAEAQAREAQIEAALEKVRSRSLAMHKSDELHDVVMVVLEKLQALGVALTSISINIFVEGSKDIDVFACGENEGRLILAYFRHPYFDHRIVNDQLNAWEKGLDFFSNNYTTKEKDSFYEYLFEHSDLKNLPVDVKGLIQQSKSYTLSMALSKNSAIAINDFDGKILSEKEKDILKRFAKVFEQSYIRFLDLQKAEAQVREARIEAALERTRTQSMLMQHSTELDDTLRVFHQQVLLLGIRSAFSFLWLPDEDKDRHIFWAVWAENNSNDFRSKAIDYPLDRNEPATAQCLIDWRGNEPVVSYHVPPEGVPTYFAAWQELIDGVEQLKPEYFTGGLYYVEAFMKYGCFGVMVENPLAEEEKKILGRFAVEFERTYTRFLDLQKAEAQVREARIEAALERIRSRSLAMHKSDELIDVVKVFFERLQELNFAIDGAAFIVTPGETPKELNFWIGDSHAEYPTCFKTPFYNSPVVTDIFDAIETGSGFLLRTYSVEEKNNWFEYAFSHTDYKHLPDELKSWILAQENLTQCFALAKNSGVGIHFHNRRPLSENEIDILKRFSKVFEQTYVRFLDLQKAEAQAREAQIEAALERVRSKTMAMHNSHDVGETVTLMFNELIKLGVDKIARCGIAIPDNNGLIELWTAKLSKDEKEEMIIGHINTTIHPMLRLLYDAWKSKQPYFEYVLEGDDLDSYITALNNYPGYPIKYDKGAWGAKQYHNDFFFHEGMVFAFTFQPLSAGIAAVFKRFSGVFGQTYRRFLDLQKAEAQAREARIETSLERVRSRTMGMQKSEELAEVIQLVYDQLCQLNFNIDNANFVVNYKESDDLDLWLAVNGQRYSTKMHIPYLDHPIFNRLNEAKKKGLSFFSDSLTFEEKNTFFRHFFENAPQVPQERKKAVFESPGYARSVVFMKTIALSIQNYAAIPYSDAENEVLVRFGKVFEQTYTRFNDLKIAEEQVREATIEAALERVRSKAMAMRSSGDVNATANTVFIELRKLDVDLVRCGLGLMEKESHISTIHAATNSAEGGSLEVLGNIDMNIHPVLEGIYNQWRQSKDYFPVLEEESLRTYYEALHESGISVPKWKSGEKQYGYFLQFAYGSLYAWSGKQESEITIKTLKRFTSVIGLTYTRYIELQKAESNTKEAIKQASLDRVRAEIASMRKQSDLERITPLIWEELTILGIPFIRCGVFIMDEEQKLIHTFLSTPDGKAIGAFHIPFDTSGNFKIMVDNWRHKEPYIDHWKEEAFSQFADALVKQGAIASKAQYMRTLPHEGVHLNFLPFLQGMLYVGNVSPFAEDNIDLIQAVADAFSTAYARYEDFNKLEAAKQQVENTLSDLKAAQTKLIQSEKMASLGELTAGIAHEIQNPLNFVNNFSEVNQEMIDELEEELKAGNIEEALAIAADIKQNEEKISHHGKRADGIVKGMLQHSRTGGGEKQLTNMNTLADEFLRLSYHGLRAKDKTFNAEMVTHFDPDLPKINVIVQDMGRVMLNLFNNAFYAVNQKSKTAGFDYKPEVSVSTSSENGHVTIKVKDNGTGIPESIKEKIMQPFFTTKPTGEGTGLGLSLTYDMVVKGHGGTIIVNTKEGEFTELVVQLTT